MASNLLTSVSNLGGPQSCSAKMRRAGLTRSGHAAVTVWARPADPKVRSMQDSSFHYFFSYLADFDVIMRKLISE